MTNDERRTTSDGARQVTLTAFLILATVRALAAPVTQEIKMDYFGYRPADTKVAIFTTDPGASVEIRNPAGLLIYTIPTDGGSITSKGFGGMPSGDDVWWMDLSPFTDPGIYCLYVPAWGEQSYDFEIKHDIYNDVVLAAVKSYYYQRCGVAHPAAYAGADWADAGVCHAYLSATTRYAGEPDYGPLDFTGGWHDAGDFNKYVWGAVAASIINMLRAYEENPGVYSDGDLNIPESGNGTADILDEVNFEIDWLLKMQMAGGEVLSRVYDESTGAPDSCPPSNAVHSHYYYGPDLEAGSVFTGCVAMASRVFATAGDPYGNAAALKAAALNCWNNYLLTAGNSQMKAWAAAELFYLDGTIVTAGNYVDNFYASNWSGRWLYPYFYDTQAAISYCKAPGATAAVVNNMKNSFGNAVNNLFNENDLYRNGMVNWAYHWGSNQCRAWWGAFLFQAALLNATGAHTQQECRDFAQEMMHFFHGQNTMRMTYLTNMTAYGGDHCSWQFYHAWFGNRWDLDSRVDYMGKPAAIDEPDYPYYKGVDNLGVSDNKIVNYGPPPGFIPGGPNKDYSGTAIPPGGETYYNRFYRDWADQQIWTARTWEISENSIGYNGPYIGLASYYMSAAPRSSMTPTPSVTHTSTHSPTATVTPSVTPTSTLSPTRTITATATESASHTLSATPSATATESASHTASSTPSVTATWTRSDTPMPTTSVSESATPSPTGSTSRTPTASPQLSPTPTLTPGIPEIEDHSFYPNPYTGGEGYFTYKLSAPPDDLRIKIFTVSGRKVVELKVESYASGYYEKIPFAAKDNWGNKLASGVYLYLVEVYRGKVMTDRKVGKMVILR